MSRLKSSRLKSRGVQLETLEKRELLAAEIAHGIFAQGTPQDVVDSWESRLAPNGVDELVAPILQGSRWTSGAIDSSSSFGDPMTLTWGVVPDGTTISNPGGGNEGTSDVVAFMDGIYGGAGEPVIANKPWFPIFENIYTLWADETGLNFVYEPNDDAAPLASSDPATRGVSGVRADMRIGGRFIDGNSGILAFNYYPINGGTLGWDGDMVIDTGDNFYLLNNDGPTGVNTALTNVLSHEVGHGLGIAHVLPVNGTKLMEPFVNLSFYGPQEDDIWNAHTLYGDFYESNDSIPEASDLGALRNELRSVQGRSIDETQDVDVYRFETLVSTQLSVDLKPTGSRYLEGDQGGQIPVAQVDRRAEANLTFRILDEFGVELIAVEQTPAGFDESLQDFQLDQPGVYFIEVTGASGGGTQLYDMDVRVGRTFTFQPDDGRLRLQSVNPNAGDLFSRDELNLEVTAPTELKFRFSGDSAVNPNTLADGIRITFAGVDEINGTPDDVVITPGYLGFDESSSIVVARFAEPLRDGQYRIEVFGEGVPASEGSPLLAADGSAFVPYENGSDRDVYDFDLELGARVLSVVPQPVYRNPDGSLNPQRNKIEVYFDDNDLFKSEDPNDPGTLTLKRPEFYQLIRTGDTASPSDDHVINPALVEVQEFESQRIADPNSSTGFSDVQVRVNRVILTFDTNDDSVTDASDDLANLPGTGAFRLKVGSSAPVRVATEVSSRVTTINIPGEVGDTVFTPRNLPLFGTDPGTGSPYTFSITSAIRGTGSPFDYPGAIGEPGTRDIGEEHHYTPPSTNSADGGAGIEVQFYNFALTRSYGLLDDGREIFTTISPEQMQRIREVFAVLGQEAGIQFVESVDQGLQVVVGDLSPLGPTSGGGTLGVMGSSPNTYLRSTVIMDAAKPWYNGFGRDANPNDSFFEVALHEIGHAVGLGHNYELDSGTIMDFPGTISDFVYPGKHDVVHLQHLYRPDNRDVDFYEFNVPAGESGTVAAETLAQRSTDGSQLNTVLSLYKRVGSEFVLLASNDDSFGTDSFLKFDVDEGQYFVAVTGKGNEDLDPTVAGSGGGGGTEGTYNLRLKFTPAENTIVDAAGSPIDGDADGIAGGAFNFWFKAHDSARTVYVDAAAPVGGTGTAAQPLREIDSAIALAQQRRIASGVGQTVRIVGNTGADKEIGYAGNNFAGADDNLAYEIGRIASLGQTLDDGRDLIVPAGVNVMIDAGSIFKMQASRIAVGSNEGGTDASGASIQVLGVPHLPVFFTSYNDSGVGLEESPLQQDPSPGDWGGLDIRNDVDRAEGRTDLEREGIFLNVVTGANMRFGGGVVNVNGSLQSIAPIQMNSARPTLIGNTITEAGSAAISADPASFEETTFTTPYYQRGDLFTPDYSRVGPIMYRNRVTDDAVNGVLIRIDTDPGGKLEPLYVSARFDDTEIVHVLGDDLVINGYPSGTRVQERATAPVVTTLQTVATPVGKTGLPSGTYEYVISFVDRFGNETLASVATRQVTSAVNGLSVRLVGLPAATSNYVSRRLYRREISSGPTFGLVAELDRTAANFTDSALTSGVPPLTASPRISLPDARLTVDPSIIIKSEDVRIETGFGADLIAEGVLGRPVIFTSRSDDRFGTGGTFDSLNDGNSSGAAADWAGIYASPTSRISIDHARIAFGGGTSTIDGTSSAFNTLQIYQAEARVAHTIFENNAGGVGGSDPFRTGHMPNTPAIIFVNGAEPVLVGNTFKGTVGNNVPVISVNVNDLNDDIVEDTGRQTGRVDLYSSEGGNHGPLVRDNTLEASGIAGMVVRGGLLATAGVWDDTDIVHVVAGNVTDSNQHTYGGLRLQSRFDESLVVKFLNANTGLVATGKTLDIQTRIGGTLHVIGQPDYPVVLTTIDDDTIGAGFDPSGAPLTDTGGDGPTTGSPGAWQGIQLFELSNDRNVETIREAETLISVGGDLNGNPDNAEVLGLLASGENESNDVLRLGYTIHGAISTPNDLDVYSFRATAGTQIWLDIDRTADTLDSVIELIGADGTVLAASDNSVTETTSVMFGGGIAEPMRQSLYSTLNSNGSYKDLYTVNPLDAGMRLILPGNEGAEREYFLRVRSNQQTTGIYQLQMRLKEADDFAGSTIRNAEIRYAETGIETRGLPYHSPLTGEGSNDGNTINLGNLAQQDRGTVSLSGSLANPGDADRYRFSLSRADIQSGGDLATIAVSFDIDYADGLGRPNTTLLLYQVNGTNRTLFMTSFDSNVLSDQASPIGGTDLDDLGRGSAGNQDPFLGTVELPPGDYEVVVVNNARVPENLRFQFDQNPLAADPGAVLTRIEPVNSTLRISADRFSPTPTPQIVTAANPVQVVFAGNSNQVEFTLGDVDLMVLRNDTNNQTQLSSINALSGDSNGLYYDSSISIGEIIARPDGQLLAFTGPQTGFETDANVGATYFIDPATGARANGAGTGLQTFEGGVDNAGNLVVNQAVTTGNTTDGDGMLVTAVADQNVGSTTSDAFIVARRGNNTNGFTRVTVNAAGDAIALFPNSPASNWVYRIDPNTGAVENAGGPNQADRAGERRGVGAGTQKIEIGHIATLAGDDIVGAAFGRDGAMYAFSQNGEVVRVTAGELANNPNPNQINEIGTTYGNVGFGNLVSASPAPTNITGYEDVILLIDSSGQLIAYNPVVNSTVEVLSLSRNAIPSDASAPRSLTFSQTSENLWHTTNNRNNDLGHVGGDSLYFGQVNSNPNAGTYQTGSNAHGQLESNGFDLSEYDQNDQPMLYFSYLLKTEDLESLLNANSVARDALRVYVSSEESREWTMVATNNTSQAGTFNDPGVLPPPTQQYDEFDVGINGYRDENGKGYVARQLHENFAIDHDGNAATPAIEWTQARIPLAPWAGHRDVRIRFEFNTAGESERFVTDLRAVEARVIMDAPGDREFTLRHDRTGIQQTFEFDFGTVVQAPSGSAISAGDALFFNGRQYTFTTSTTPGPRGITFAPTMPASQIAASIIAAITFDGFTGTLDPSRDSRFAVDAFSFTASTANLRNFMRVESPGVAFGNVPVPIAINSTVTDIQLAMQSVIAQTFNQGTATTADLTPYQLYRDSVRMHGFTTVNGGVLGVFQNTSTGGGLSVHDAGVYPVGAELDQYANSQYNNAVAGRRVALVQGERADNNNFEGVYLDDIIIGFAERGEVITDAATLPDVQLAVNPFHEATTSRTGGFVDQVDSGEFQLNIRLSHEYAFPDTSGDPPVVLTFDTNDVLGKSVSLSFGTATNPLSGGEIPDGSLIFIADERRQLIFEFDNNDLGASNGVTPGNIPVTYLSTFTASQMASALVSAINDPNVQADFDVFATMSDGTVDADSGIRVFLEGPVAATLQGGTGFAPSLPNLRVRIYGGLPDPVEPLTGTPLGFDGGDSNNFRDQGQVVLKNNVIVDSSNFGINIDAGPRRADLPSPGASQAYTTDNPDDLVPGVVVVNSVLIDNANAGIRLGGDTVAISNAPNQFARLINNTIVGGQNGVLITEGASPTLINNAIANATTAIRGVNAGAVEIFATLFLNNGTNVNPAGLGVGAFPVFANAGDPVFVDVAGRDLYPEFLSLLIDNSVGAVNDRLELAALRTSIGLAASPIIAPVRDITDQPRAAAPNNNGGGTGSNIFIDIGAFDRSDLIGPFATLIDPLDNGSIDADISESFVRVISGTLDRFEIQILDENGIGLDDSSVTADKLNLSQDGRLLIEGVDYIFGYSATNNTILLTPITGIWNPNSAYEITLNNRDRLVASAPSGSGIVDGDQLPIGDADGNFVTFEFDSGFLLSQTGTAIADGDTLVYRAGNAVVQFEFNNTDLPATPNHPATSVVIDFSSLDTPAQLAARIANAFKNVTYLNLNTARDLEGDRIYLGGVGGDVLTVNSAGLQLIGTAGVTPGTVAIPYLPSSSYAAETMAGTIIARVVSSNLNINGFTPGGGLVYLEGVGRDTTGVPMFGGLPFTEVDAVIDKAGNTLEPNRNNRETQFTVLMPGVRLDFGDAFITTTPRTYPTTLAGNGARHTIGTELSPRLGSITDSETDSALNDDAVVTINSISGTGGLSGVLSGNTATVTVIAPSSGDTLRVDVGGVVRNYQLVLATQPALSGYVPVLFIPGEPDMNLTERLAKAVSDDLEAINSLIAVEFERQTNLFTIASLDDEEGVLVGSVTVGGSTVDGLFLDVDGSVLGFLNPSAPNGTEIVVNTTGNGLLDAWVDFNADGDFLDPGEKVLSNKAVLDGSNRIVVHSISDPAILNSNSIAQTWMRFRISNTGNTTTNGVVIGGEVEDYRVLIADAALPEPVDDLAGFTFEDNAIEIIGTDLLANDISNGVSPLGIEIEQNVVNGTLVFNGDPLDPRWTYTPERDFYGNETFTYRLTGMLDLGGGQILPVRSSRAATVTITVVPVNDQPMAVDHNQFQVDEPVDLGTTSVDIASGDLLLGAVPKLPLTAVEALTPGSALVPPWDESEQVLTVIQIAVIDASGTRQDVVPIGVDQFDLLDGTFSAVAHVPDGSGGFIPIGTVSATVLSNEITNVRFSPAENYNDDNPVVPPADDFTFIYTIADDAATTLPQGGQAVPLPPRQTNEATVSVQVIPQNDSPIANDDRIAQVGGVRLDEDAVAYRIPTSLVLGNDTAGPPSTTIPFFLGTDDEISGANIQFVELVTQFEPSVTVSLGNVNAGIAVHDNALGTGYVMYSPQNLYSRFALNPPPVLPAGPASDQMIAVRFNGFGWEYSNNTTWVSFMPIPGDRLIATLDFDNNQIAGLKYAGGTVNGIEQGYFTDNSTGELNFIADQFGGVFDAGEFTVTGSQFKISTDPNFPLEFRPYESRLTDQGGLIDYDSVTGELVYTPAPNFYGLDTFTYVIRDVPVDPLQPHQTLYSVGTVTLEVYPVNDAPLAQNQMLSIEEDEVITVTAADLLAGAIPHFANPAIAAPQNESGQSLKVVSLTVVDSANIPQVITSDGVYQTNHGTIRNLQFNVDGSLNQFIYEPNLDFNVDNPRTGGSRTLDQFLFTIEDSDQADWPEGGTRPVTPLQNTATAFVSVAPQNDAPDTQPDRITAEPGSAWANYFGGDPNLIPVPREGSQNVILIPIEFLLSNDNLGPATAGDEINGANPLNDSRFSQQLVLNVSLPATTTALGGSVQLVTQQGRRFVQYTPPEDAFGVDTFLYTGTDRGIDEATDGTRVNAPLSSNGLVSLLVEPTNDAPVSFDRILRGVEDTSRPFTAADLLAMSSGQPTLPIVADPLRDPLYNETEQIPNLRVTAIIANGQEIRTSTVPGSPIPLGYGSLDLTFAGGVFVSGVYTPTVPDNNELIGIDQFQYIVADNGTVAIPGSGAFFGELFDRDATLPTVEGAPSRVTLPLTPVNDDPVFNQVPVNILERDDTGSPSTFQWANQIKGGPTTAIDEQGQVVHFQLISFSDPEGLFWRAPVLDRFSGSIDLYPDVDQFGQATFIVGVNDSQYLPNDPAFQNPQIVRTITINLRPVNDAPGINSAAINVFDSNPAMPTDDAYSVGPDGTISYTLKENNVDSSGVPQPYSIALTNPNYLPSLSSGDYQPPGLLDVFLPGPANEISTAIPNAQGGSQSLYLVDVFGSNNTVTTDKNGTLEAVRDTQGNITSLLYTPAPDFNFAIGGLDTFRYSVIDDGVSYINGQLRNDPRSIFGRISFNIQPVNSKPVFNLPANPPEVLEDAGLRNIIGFATGIRPGAATASDETSQGTQFHVTPTSFAASQMSNYFTTPPTITRDGTLTYRTAPNVFGVFTFDVHLCDDGLTDSLEAPCVIGTVGTSDRGDVNRSDTRSFTLSVLPTNDAPVTADGNPAPAIVLDEDTDIVLGFGANPGGYDLLSAFVGGPPNELISTVFGGNTLRAQTVSLVQSQFPATTLLGVQLQPVLDSLNNLIGYRYEPPTNYAGGDQLVYDITDDGQSVRIGSGLVPINDPKTTRVTVPIVVNPINDPPVSSADDDVTSLDVMVTEGDGLYFDPNWMLGVAVGPFDAVDEIGSQQLMPPVLTVNSSNLSFVSPPTAQLSGDKVSLRFEALEDSFGVAEYVVTLTDDGGTPGNTGDDESTSYTFTITIEGVNDPPTFDADDSLTVLEDSGAYSGQYATNIDVGPLEVTQTIDRFEVSIPVGLEDLFSTAPTVTPDGLLTFTPAPDAAGEVVLSITAVDSDGGRSVAHDLTVTIQDINDPPVANDDPITVDEDSVRVLTVGDLISNDTDPDLNNRPPFDTEVLSIQMAADFTSAAGAHVTFDSTTGRITYDPRGSATLDQLTPGQSILDTFTYTLSDGELTDTAVVTLTVTGTNDAPRLGNDFFDVTPDRPTVLPVLDNDIDVDGTIVPTSIIITTQPKNGALEVDVATGRVTYTPLQGFRGTDQFRYTVADNLGQQSEQATVDLRIGSAPLTVPVFTGTAMNHSVNIAPLTGVDGEPVPSTMTIVSQPTGGSAQLMADGEILYTPAANYTGKDSIVFTVADPAGFVSQQTTIDITVVESTLQNPVKFRDVNASGTVTPIDALLIINRLGLAGGNGSVPVQTNDQGPNYYDANGDMVITPSDALSVINELALQQGSGSSEGESVPAAEVTPPTPVTPLGSLIAAPTTGSSIESEDGPMDAEAAVDKIVSSEVLTPAYDQLVDLIAVDGDDDEDEAAILSAFDEALNDLLD